MDSRLVPSDHHHRPEVLEGVGAPVPHVEGMDPVVGVAGPVEVDVPGVGGERLLEPVGHLDRIGRLAQHLLEEVDVARVVDRVELPRGGVAHDDHAALADQRLAPVEVEEVSEPEARHQDRVEDRVHVVGADVGEAHGQDVGLSVDLHPLLIPDVLGGQRVHGLDLAGLHRCHPVGGLDRVEDLPGQARRGAVEGLGGGQVAEPVLGPPLPLPLLQEAECGREGVVVEGGLDLEDGDAAGRDEAAHPPVGGVQLRAVLVHERAALLHGEWVVMVPEAPVAGQSGGHALVAAVHGHQVDVDVDEQVALGGSLVDLHVLALVGETEVDEGIGVLGVVLGEQPVGGKGVVDAVAEGVAELGLGHPTVEGQGHDEGDVVDPGLGRHVQHLLDDHLADVGLLHRRERQ